MCGIVGYIGNKKVEPILVNGLRRLEYRGYDSAGVAVYDGDKIHTFKQKGSVQNLADLLKKQKKGKDAVVGIGHTRWATHGEPSKKNAHPHTSHSGDFTLVHNGTIENYDTLKKELRDRGYDFVSDTDTEVLVTLIEDVAKNTKLKTFEKIVQAALRQVVGAYAIVVMGEDFPEQLIAAKNGSPLLVGLGSEEIFIGSDATPFIDKTKKVIELEDGDMISLREKGEYALARIDSGKNKIPYIQEMELSIEQIEKGRFPHFMLKEIFEQPKVLEEVMSGRISRGDIRLGGLETLSKKDLKRLLEAPRIIIVACGTSWHTGMVAEYFFESIAGVSVEVEYASEFRYRDPIITEKDVVIAISQSGETADTLAALKLAKKKGALTLGVVNTVGSSIARITEAGVYLRVGPEIGVASTKAFTGQLMVLYMIGLYLAKENKNIPAAQIKKYLKELSKIPSLVEEILKSAKEIKRIAKIFKKKDHSMYLGRRYGFPVALEGALKIKEVSYIHAEGFPAAEMKHGPIALIDKNMPIVVVANRVKGKDADKIKANIEESKARGGSIISIITKGDAALKKLSDYVIEIPDISEPLSPLLTVIPLQLLAYYAATDRDRKSVV